MNYDDNVSQELKVIFTGNEILTLKDPGYFEVYFLEKWSLSYQIVFQVKI